MIKKLFLSLCILIAVLFVNCNCVFAIEFSADMKSTSQGISSLSKIYVKGNKFRIDNSEQGMRSTTIIRQDKNVMWMVMPSEQTYMEMPIKKDQIPKVQAKEPGEISRKLLGNETVNGYQAQKYLVTVMDKGKKNSFYQWISTGQNLPVKMQATDNSWILEYKNIRNSVPASLFEVPAGFQKMGFPGMPNFNSIQSMFDDSDY